MDQVIASLAEQYAESKYTDYAATHFQKDPFATNLSDLKGQLTPEDFAVLKRVRAKAYSNDRQCCGTEQCCCGCAGFGANACLST